MSDPYVDELRRALGESGTAHADALASVREHLEEAERAGVLDETLARLGSPASLAERILGAHRHLDPVELPGGVVVWAASHAGEDYARDRPPDFGLYLDTRWSPPWPHAHVDWPDFGVPADRAALTAALADALDRGRRGEVVEVGCLGGHGRTGTALACLAVLAGVDGDPVDWVRSSYCQQAVETDEQAALVRSLRRPADPLTR